MKKWTLLLCLLVASTAAQAQFEKGKWFVSPGLTGLNLSYDTGMDKASFGLNVKGGAFVLDNVALLIRAGMQWNEGASQDVYGIGVGARYYFDRVGIYLGADMNVDRNTGAITDDTKFSFGMDAGYAFFLSKTVSLEPGVYWNINGDRSKFGLQLGFGFYF